MFAVYAEAATEVRRLLDRQSRQRLLDRPHCAALFCLFRSLDENAVEFLNTYAAAIDAETGEAVMMIIFFDDVNVLGESAEHKRLNVSSTIPPVPELPVLQCEGVLDGAGAVDQAFKFLGDGSARIGTRRFRQEIPDFATYRASPEWSLKFSDANRIGWS